MANRSLEAADKFRVRGLAAGRGLRDIELGVALEVDKNGFF